MKHTRVFSVTNLINNKIYFGLTDYSLEHRESCLVAQAMAKPRKMKLKDAYTGRSPISKAILKYGRQNFTFKTLHSEISRKEAHKIKKGYIKKYNTMNIEYGYNCTNGGDKSFKLAKHSKDRMSVSATGKTMPQSFVDTMKKRVGELHPTFGYKHTKKARKNMRQGQLDSSYVKTDEHKKKTSETMKRRWQEPEIIAKMAKRTRPPITEETRKKMSRASSGKNNGMYGRRKNG
tara:strand:- start:960 stop:1658 length:699 start_codon:yes stop_codon:yes gene_type:complete